MSKVALCADQASLLDSSLIGLQDENVIAQKWLDSYSQAVPARNSIAQTPDLVEVWVVGCDDAAAINLAAAIKHDNPHLRVCLAAFEGGGSLLSRANAASIDAVYNEAMFVRRYAAVKAALSGPPTRFPLVAFEPSGQVANRVSADGEGKACDSSETVVLSGCRADLGSACQTEASSSPSFEPKAEDPFALSLGKPRAVALKTAFLLPVLSASGGAGKSTVSALAALCTQMHGKRTLLLDFDFQFGNVSGFFRDSRPLPVDELLKNPACIDDLESSEILPAIVSPPQNPEEAEVIARHIGDLIELFSFRFEVVVANTGALWGEQHAALLERSSKALFLVDQRASSLQACRRALQLCERCGIATGPLLFTVNRCGKNAPLSSIDVSCALKGVEAVELRDGGNEVEEYSSAGVLVDLAATANPLYASVDGLLSGIIPGFGGELPHAPKAPEARSRRRGFFRKGEGR